MPKMCWGKGIATKFTKGIIMMRLRLNADGHDESQYLPRDVPIVNAFREKRGGVRYEGTAVKAIQWMPDILFDRDNEKEKPYNDTCVSFFGYYVMAGQALGISDIRNILFDRIEEGTQLPPVDTFSAIMLGLAKPESNMLLWVVNDDRNRGNVALGRHLIGTIRHAVENMQNILDTLAQKRRLEKSNALSCAQNFPR